MASCACGQLDYKVVGGRLVLTTTGAAIIVHGTDDPNVRKLEHIHPECGTCVSVDLRVSR